MLGKGVCFVLSFPQKSQEEALISQISQLFHLSDFCCFRFPATIKPLPAAKASKLLPHKPPDLWQWGRNHIGPSGKLQVPFGSCALCHLQGTGGCFLTCWLLLQFPEVVPLNVGGMFFTTRLSTLRRYEDTMLAAMFSGRHYIPTDAEGRYFIDRDGTYFGYVQILRATFESQNLFLN